MEEIGYDIFLTHTHKNKDEYGIVREREKVYSITKKRDSVKMRFHTNTERENVASNVHS